MEPSNGSYPQGTPVWFGYFVFEEICLNYAVLFVILLLVGFWNEHGDAQEVKVFYGEMLSR